jgi:RNA polymerase sigma-70 factor (ECF subfamily)
MQCTEMALGFSAEAGGQCTRAEEFDSMVSHHLPRLYRKACQYLGNVHDAEDAVQDALLSAYKNLSQFRGQAQLSTWLTSIVINAARMHLRRRANVPHVPLDEQLGDGDLTLSDMLSDRGPSPEELCRVSELREQFSKFAKYLSPSLRRSFQLRVIDGLTTAEIAHALGIAEGTVKAQLSRARANFVRRIREATRGARIAAGSARATAPTV